MSHGQRITRGKVIKNHGMVAFSSEFRALCQPVFDSTPINYIGANRIYYDGGRTYLNSDPYWAELYIKNQFHLAGTEEDLLEMTPDSHHPWFLSSVFKLNPESEALYQGCIAHNYANGITLVERGQDFVDLFHICAKGGQERVNHYLLHNIDYLWQIVLYLKEGIYESKLLRQVYQLKHYCDDLPSIKEQSVTQNSLLQSIKVKKYYLGGYFGDVGFTQREMDCLVLIYQHKTYKEQARILNISHRTVETHIEKIKTKTGIASNMELILELAKNNGFGGLLKQFKK